MKFRSPFKSLTFRTYCHATEDFEKVVKTLAFISGLPEKRFKTSRTEGHYGNLIRILTVETTNVMEINDFWTKIANSELYEQLDETLCERVGEKDILYCRFDKNSAFDQKFLFASNDNCIIIQARFKNNVKIEELREYLHSKKNK